MFYDSAFGLSKGEIAGSCLVLECLAHKNWGDYWVSPGTRGMNAGKQSSSKIREVSGCFEVRGEMGMWGDPRCHGYQDMCRWV